MNTKRRVVVTGIGTVTCMGADTKQLWQNLLAKKSGISHISRFDCTDYRCKVAGEIKNFEASSHIPKRDLQKLDFFSQYGLTASYEALEDAGLKMDEEDLERFGVILGSGMGGMMELEHQQNVIRQKGPKRISPYLIPKVMVNAVAGEISIRLGLKGPSYVVAAACASSTQR